VVSAGAATWPDRSEVHVPKSVIDFCKATLALGEQVTDVHPALVSADLAVAADESTLVMAGVDLRREL